MFCGPKTNETIFRTNILSLFRAISVSYAFKKDSKGERHGSAAERLLAAQNPLSQADRPHQLFADAPPVPVPGPPMMGGNMPPAMHPPGMPGMPMPPRPPMPPGMAPGQYPPMPSGPPPGPPGKQGWLPPPPPPQVWFFSRYFQICGCVVNLSQPCEFKPLLHKCMFYNSKL